MKTIKILLLLFVTTAILSCKKYLDAKPDATLATPSTLKDLQGLLDDYRTMNFLFCGGTGILTDNYYLTDNDWASMYREDFKNYYIWQKDDNNNSDWNSAYQQIYTCNLVLESLKTIKSPSKEEELSENIKGTALFFRASYFYSLAQLFAKSYDKNTAGTDLGIPLRLNTSFDQKSVRSTVKETYLQIIDDFKQSITLLPESAFIKSRPVKAAAYGSLARTYLAMEDYSNAYAYADSCLKLYDILINYSSVDTAANIPFARFNDEVIFGATSYPVLPNSAVICKIDSNLYKSYNDNDLRKLLFFKKNQDGSYSFKGDYDGSLNNGYGHSFTGIVTDEQYLIIAESAARLGKTDVALQYLNGLLKNRFKEGSFVPVTTTDSLELLSIVLSERRKELLFRDTRWTDLKRLNKDPRFAVKLTRVLNGKIYQLPASEIKYVALIPKTVITMSGMQQN